jgi:tetratricopeptide (TPR) repeat protein
MRLAPGVTLNLSKSGASLSFGPRGAKYTIGPRGQRTTVGVPGTGLFYTVHAGSRRSSPRVASTPTVPVADRLSLGFFQRLTTPANERALVEGLKALYQGDERAALDSLEQAADLPDATWLAGMLCLKQERLDTAERYLGFALSRLAELGALFAKYGVEATVSLPITPEVSAHVQPGERGTLLALVEVYQLQGREKDALRDLERLLALDAHDPVVLLSFAELALVSGEAHAVAQRVVSLTAGVGNESPIDTALLLYKGRALLRLGLCQAAAEAFTTALRRRKDRSKDLLRQIRYERALAYEALGRKAAARRDFERLYAEAPGFEDVGERLGIA